MWTSQDPGYPNHSDSAMVTVPCVITPRAMIILRLVLLRSYNTTGNYKTVNWDMALFNNTTGNANAAPRA